MAVSVEVKPSFRVVGRPVELFRGSYRSLADPGSALFNYDVTPDGEHFVMVEKGAERGLSGELHVIIDWAAELERLVPTGK
jgi:hypothetical protein